MEQAGAIGTSGEAATRAVGRALADLVCARDVILLSGDLGAGKTVLVKGLGEGLGVSEPITSPTFNILLVHEGRIPLYHIDLYRLEAPEELDDIDYRGTVEADGVSMVEWGDRFEAARPREFVSATITIVDDATRRIDFATQGERGARLAEAWRLACRGIPGVWLEAREQVR